MDSSVGSGDSFEFHSPPPAPRGDKPTLYLVLGAVSWGILIVLGAMTVPVVTVPTPPALAPAPPSLGPPASPTPAPNNQPLSQSPRVSVLKRHDAAGVAVAAVPAATSLLVGGLLWVASSRQRRSLALIAAWTLSAALLGAGIVGFVTFLVGIVAVPTSVLLLLACHRAAPWPVRSNLVGGRRV